VRKTGTVTASLLLATPLILFAGHAAAEEPTCYGRAATITGSGSIMGTPGNDVIVGSEEADSIDGAGGNDRICGLGGADEIEGGLGNDRINGGPDNDLLVGDVYEVDASAVGGGNDLMQGGPGVDHLIGDSYAFNPTGIDVDATGGGDDVLRGGPDADNIVGDSEGATATGAGDDTILSGPGVDDGGNLEVVLGDSVCENSCIGDGGDDSIRMGTDGGMWAAGDHAGSGNATFEGDGNDFIVGGVGRDVEMLFGDNVFVGAVGQGLPSPAGGAGNDILRGRLGPDLLVGQGGADRLNGGADEDQCDAESGIDRAISCEVVVVP
jgi:Ca2+-binding RTX toxin-like protein